LLVNAISSTSEVTQIKVELTNTLAENAELKKKLAVAENNCVPARF